MNFSDRCVNHLTVAYRRAFSLLSRCQYLKSFSEILDTIQSLFCRYNESTSPRKTHRSSAPILFERFRKWLSSNSSDLVVDLGDRISDVDRTTDEKLIREIALWFSDISCPHFHLAGNHDLEKLTINENEKLLGFSLRSVSTDVNRFHLIFWNAGSKLDHQNGFSLLPEELVWLKEDLSRTELPTIIFTHIPLDNGSMKGNFYFEKAYPHHACYKSEEGEKIRDVIERSKKVILCVNGHAHWNAYHCIDGIHYITLPSLTETFPTYPKVCESWAKLSVGEDIHLRVFGNLPIEYRLPIRQLNTEHWLNVDKDYAPQVTTPQ